MLRTHLLLKQLETSPQIILSVVVVKIGIILKTWLSAAYFSKCSTNRTLSALKISRNSTRTAWPKVGFSSFLWLLHLSAGISISAYQYITDKLLEECTCVLPEAVRRPEPHQGWNTRISSPLSRLILEVNIFWNKISVKFLKTLVIQEVTYLHHIRVGN